MKKFQNLTSVEAIRYFILRDKKTKQEETQEINSKLNDLDKLKSDVCISIVLPTHHTKPDYEKDIIQLKNLVVETENELIDRLGKRKAAAYIENIKEAQASVDYSLSLDGMVIYANEHFASVVKLPVDLTPSILIDKNFDLRPLYKTRQQNRRYYVLAISRNYIRLIEAFNDAVVWEADNQDFPFRSDDYYVDEAAELAQDSFIDNQVKEFFNDADKRFQRYNNLNPLPVILAGDIKMISYYEQQMDKEGMVIAKVNGNFDNIPYHEIIKAVHPELEKYREDKQKEYMDQIDAGQSSYLLSTDINEIYRTARDGAADTLYISENFTLNGTIEEDNLEITQKEEGDINRSDLLSVLLTLIRDNGGNTIFVEDDRMQQFNGIALVRRW